MSNKITFDQKITNKVFNSIKNKMPKISQTEQDAIDAGNIWVEGDIYRGEIDWKEILEYKVKDLSDKELNFIENKVNPLLEMVDEEEIQKLNDLPENIWDYLKKEKFFSFIIPEEYGGLGFSAKANSTIVSMLASVSSTLAVTVMVPNSLGPSELLLHYGTEEQRNKWLPNLASGKDIPCFGLTSEDAGSDAGALIDSGVVVKKQENGKEVIGIELNFNKRYITLAPVATVMGLAFKLYDPNQILGDKEELGITLALIPTDRTRVDNSKRHNPMNLSFMNGQLIGQNVFISMDEIIGGEKMIGKGWSMLVECLSAGRGISLPALSGAISQNCVRLATSYTLIREQFNTPIHNFEGIQESILKILSNNHAINSLREFTNYALDSGNNPSVVSAITKYHTTEMAREALTHTMDILGGKAIIQGDLNPIADAYKGIPVAITVEGANILTRYLMIFGQGSIRCHKFLLSEIESLNHEDTEKGQSDFNTVFKSHIKSTSTKSIVNFLSGLSFNLFNSAPKNIFRKEIVRINQLSRSLNIISDITLLDLGGKLKYKEYLSSLLGDVLSHLFIATSVIFNSQKKISKDLSKYTIQEHLYKAEMAFIDFLEDYESYPKSIIMRLINFPFGVRPKKPSFKKNKKLVNDYIYNKELREEEVPESSLLNKKINIFEEAYYKHLDYHLYFANDELLNRIKNNYKKTISLNDNIELLALSEIISNEEKEYLLDYYQHKKNVIQVNSQTK